MKRALFQQAICVASLILTLVFPCVAQDQAEPPAEPPPSAAGIFEQTLAESGLEAAKARLREVMADTTGGLPHRRV